MNKVEFLVMVALLSCIALELYSVIGELHRIFLRIGNVLVRMDDDFGAELNGEKDAKPSGSQTSEDQQ